jgi:hypothetical protein
MDRSTILLAICKGLALPKITRRRAKTMKEWPEFLRSEWSQLNKYHKQGMFGTPCPQPHQKDPKRLSYPGDGHIYSK